MLFFDEFLDFRVRPNQIDCALSSHFSSTLTLLLSLVKMLSRIVMFCFLLLQPSTSPSIFSHLSVVIARILILNLLLLLTISTTFILSCSSSQRSLFRLVLYIEHFSQVDTRYKHLELIIDAAIQQLRLRV